MRTAPKRVDAAIALIERRGRLLICRRPAHVRFGGYWEFPGGKRRPRETWAACARREVREEVGLALKRLRPVGTLKHQRQGQVYYLAVFYAVAPSGRAQALESQETRWVKPATLGRYKFPPANRPLLRAIINVT